MAAELNLQTAMRILGAAIEKSKDLNIQEDIAVVDSGGNLKAFARMDEAWLGSIDIAIRKARTARLFNMETGKIGERQHG